jgi:hypothetical protein
MSGMPIADGTTGITMGVDTDARAKVNLANISTPTQVGAVRIVSENDDGSIIGTPDLVSPETSDDYRLRVGIDSIWDEEVFAYTAQNTSKHRVVATTLTLVYGGQYLIFNGAVATTANSGVRFQTYSTFPIMGASSLYVEFQGSISAVVGTNTTIDAGLFSDGGATPFAPTDGVFFRISSAGVFGVVNYNSVETVAPVPGFTMTPGQTYRFTITLARGQIKFWIDNLEVLRIARSPNLPATVQSASLPFAVRHAIVAAASSGCSFRLGSYTVSIGDLQTGRLWATQQVGMGLSGIQGASGHTQGQTANYVNSTAPVAATLANATAGYTTKGGQFAFALLATLDIDFALFAFQVPTPSATVPGKKLIIRGMWIDTVNTGLANSATPVILQWGIAVGSTGVSLATAEAAAGRAPRREALGFQTLAAAAPIGQKMENIDRNFDAPLIVEPGTYLHIFFRIVSGAVNAGQVIRGTATVNSFWE